MAPTLKGHSTISKSKASKGKISKGSSRTRGQQLVVPGHGIHYTSPQKKQVAARKKEKIICYATAREVSDLSARMEVLKKNAMAAKQFQEDFAGSVPTDCPIPNTTILEGVKASEPSLPAPVGALASMEIDQSNVHVPNNESTCEDSDDDEGMPCNWEDDPGLPFPPPKRLTPDKTAEELYKKWKVLLPSFVKPFLQYSNSMAGKEWTRPPAILASQCIHSSGLQCLKTVSRVTSLLFASFMDYEVTACNCEPLAIVLVRNGLFPTAPTNPRQAVSLELLDLFLALMQRSSDAVTALAAALNTSYKNCAFVALNSMGGRVKQPFRKGIGYALQWYQCLRVEVKRRKEAAIASKLHDMFGVPIDQTQPTGPSNTEPETLSPPQLPVDAINEGQRNLPATVPEGCHWILQSLCPACFGGKMFGRPFDLGGDCQVSCNGNFNHRHLRLAANSPGFYLPVHFIPKEQVDRIGEQIEKAQKHPVPLHTPVPDEAIKSCKNSHEAGTGSTVKTSLERFDIGGLATLVCRHGIPLFVANINTPGEQQKYAVLLIQHLFSFLPKMATVTVLYDIGCVIDASMCKFGTSAMHAYVHQWACQLHYNPRLKPGMGLTNGEAVERLWSRARHLIPVCRTSLANRRVLLIDSFLQELSAEMVVGLGSFICRKLAQGVEKQQKEAKKILSKCGIENSVLQEQWAQQKEVQLLLCSLAPGKLKTQLNHILCIQSELKTLEASVAKSNALLNSGSLPQSCRPALQALQQQFNELKGKADSMATHVFWEFDKLDRAAGGKDMATSTKMHQALCSTMTKRTSTLNHAIKNFNRECAKLVKLNKPHYQIPILDELPTKLADLKKCSTLIESVWVAPVDESVHRWVYDADMREGIRAFLKLDRCTEEQRRLGEEADNMLRWHRMELSAIIAALQDPANSDLVGPLHHEYKDVVALSSAWQTPLVPEALYKTQTESVTAATTLPLTWMPITVTDESAEVPEEIELTKNILLDDMYQEEMDSNGDKPTVTIPQRSMEVKIHATLPPPSQWVLSWETPMPVFYDKIPFGNVQVLAV
ncbi:hypothetical protein H1R20_g6330, partial [Candolleomyces eurysporus]